MKMEKFVFASNKTRLAQKTRMISCKQLFQLCAVVNWMGRQALFQLSCRELSTLRKDQWLERPTFPLSIDFVYQQLSSANSSCLPSLKTMQTLRRSGSFGRAPVVVVTPSFV